MPLPFSYHDIIIALVSVIVNLFTNIFANYFYTFEDTIKADFQLHFIIYKGVPLRTSLMFGNEFGI